MKQIAQKINSIAFLILVVSAIAVAQQTDSSSYFPLGFWGIWADVTQPPFNVALNDSQWIQERNNWRDIKGNYLVSWTPMSVEDTVMKFADENNYKMAVSNSTYGNPSWNIDGGLQYWFRYRNLADSNIASSIISNLKTHYNGHAGFHSYFFDDEKPVENSAKWPMVEFAARKIHEIDPTRKSYISHGPVPVQAFFDATPSLDIFQFDHYSFGFTIPQTYIGQQSALDNLIPYYDDLRNRLKGKRTEWQAIIQTQEDIVSTSNLRRPNFYELRVQAYLALSRGARGITSYVYGSILALSSDYRVRGLVDIDPTVGNKRRKWEQVHLPGVGETTPFQNVTNLNLELAPLGSTIRKLRVYDAFPNYPTIPTNAVGISTVSGDKIEIGTFKRIDTGTDSTKYFMLVNRVCTPSGGGSPTSQPVEVTFSSASSQEIIEVVSGKIWIVKPYGKFIDNLEPGSGKLYRIGPATWSGTKNIVSTVTIPIGATLNVNAGTTLKFAPNTGITAKGILNINGSSSSVVTLTTPSGTGTPGSWGSILLDSSGASGSNLNYVNMYYGTEIRAINVPSVTIHNSHIEKTINGINFYGSTGLIDTNIIKNVQDHGILAYGSSHPRCYNNTIFKNSTDNNYHSGAGILFADGSNDYIWHNDIRGFNWGVGTIWGASPQFSSSQNNGINNRITDCIYGLEVYQYSNPVVGNTYYLYYPSYGNSIYGNVSLSADVSGHSSVYAHNVYWGTSYYPSYYTDWSSSFYAYPYISPTDPWINTPLPSRVNSSTPVLADNVMAKTVSPTSGGLTSVDSAQGQKHLFEGIAYRELGKHKVAFSIFSKMIAEDEEPNAAIVELYNTYSESTKDDVYNYLKIASQGEISIAPHLLSAIHLRRGEIKEAKAVNESIIKNHPNTEDETHAKIQQLYIALYYEKNFDLASLLLTDIQKTENADKNIEVSIAQHALATYGNANGTKEAFSLKKESRVAEHIPEEFDLLQNYPNPFNPTTTIAFSIPEAENVRLVVYDYLGREISILLDGFTTAGKHEIQFNASKLSSGIYLYKIISGRNVATKKMLLLK
ncbi:MAG: T9SS type A sorting domain-containing protein [Bacteroidota bacterium]|nr:T9SS type A sorting domain-containing protein [Bacteroidota bacterium]